MNWLALENEMREVTTDTDTYYRYVVTGKQRAWLFGVRVPVWLVKRLSRWSR